LVFNVKECSASLDLEEVLITTTVVVEEARVRVEFEGEA